jgi:hypothetical protein
MGAGSPLLVTGLPRSGTSWVGKMLEASGSVTYVNEPLNPSHPPGHSPGVLAVSPEHQFQYICADNDAVWAPAFRNTIALRYNLVAELRRNHGAYDLARMVKYASAFTIGRIRGRRAMIDDPFALFSTRWFVERLGARALVLVRDPVAVVGSYRRFGWTYHPEELRAQTLLVRNLHPHPASLLDLAGSDDHVAKLAHLWRVAYLAVDRMRGIPGVLIRRYEDLVNEPLEGFAQLYDEFDLPWTDRARRKIEAATTATGNAESGFAWSLRGGPSRTAFRPMDKEQALASQVGRISEPDAERVRAITADVAQLFYPSA